MKCNVHNMWTKVFILKQSPSISVERPIQLQLTRSRFWKHNTADYCKAYYPTYKNIIKILYCHNFGNFDKVPITIVKCVPYTIKCSWVSCKITEGCRWTEIITNKTIRICYKLNIPHNATYSVSCRVVLQILIYIYLSLIHIWRCRRSYACRSRWSPYH